eukprot:2242709-Amphidinium_carterae.1
MTLEALYLWENLEVDNTFENASNVINNFAAGDGLGLLFLAFWLYLGLWPGGMTWECQGSCGSSSCLPTGRTHWKSGTVYHSAVVVAASLLIAPSTVPPYVSKRALVVLSWEIERRVWDGLISCSQEIFGISNPQAESKTDEPYMDRGLSDKDVVEAVLYHQTQDHAMLEKCVQPSQLQNQRQKPQEGSRFNSKAKP